MVEICPVSWQRNKESQAGAVQNFQWKKKKLSKEDVNKMLCLKGRDKIIIIIGWHLEKSKKESLAGLVSSNILKKTKKENSFVAWSLG